MNHAERMQAVWKDPTRAVETADSILALMKSEWQEMVLVRETAARLYGSAPMPDLIAPTPAGVVVVETKAADTASQTAKVENLSALFDLYKTHEKSPYRKIAYATRKAYDNNMRRLLADFPKPLNEITRAEIEEYYEGWQKRDRATMGNSLITMFRMAANFGSHELNDLECTRLALIFRNLEMVQPQSRHERMTEAHAKAIIEKCNEKSWYSIGLAQALQFYCGLHQKDVIGQWVPSEEQTPPTEIVSINGKKKWVSGIRWSEIKDMVLVHEPSAGGDTIRLDLRQFDPVHAQLAAYYKKLPKVGAVIVDPETGLPFENWTFTRQWRTAANEAGVPTTVKNMDSRASRELWPQKRGRLLRAR